MDDRRILSTTRNSSSEVVRASFATVRKGYDPAEVRAYLDGVAREMQLFETRLADLQHQLAEALRKAANPVLDEATLAAALGSQSAAILRSAHDEAGRVTAEAQERATHIFTQAQERATSSLVDAQERAAMIVSDAENTATHVEEDARAGSQRLVDSAKVNGEALVERAREQGRAIVVQAQDARRAVLNDLAVKRKSLHVQIDQLRAARDSLQQSISTVRESVEGVLTGLMSSDEGARSAAIEALRNRPAPNEPSEEEVLSTIPMRQVPDLELTPLDDALVAPPLTTLETRIDDASATDAVEEMDELLSELERNDERGASAPAPKKLPAVVSPPTATSEHFVRRDEALASSLAQLTRRIKRALQDDQNVMIERLRGVSGLITTEFEDEMDQRTRYANAARESLREAALAAGIFVKGEVGSSEPVVVGREVEECAADLAVTVVLALRKRIVSEGNGDGAERANSAYKEWRGARVERLCTDMARRAFNSGVIQAASGRTVSFVVAPNDAPCDACALDAQSAPRPAGEIFPSGQSHPPLHAGCACTIFPL